MRANPSVSKRPILYGFFFELLSIFLQFQSFLIKSIYCLLFIHEKRLRGLRMGFSAFKILKEGLTGNKGWKTSLARANVKKKNMTLS